tara:strand:+ start:1028 stop:1330 length:303 start_codon:yes stop_codon:yes gene_type:complete
MATIKWSTGETYSQSYRKKKLEEKIEEKIESAEEMREENMHGIGRNFVFKDNYKEEALHRIGEREQVQQCCVNPFVGNNFLKDLAVQEEYLKPKNSNYSK